MADAALAQRDGGTGSGGAAACGTRELFVVGQAAGRGWVRQQPWEVSLDEGDLAVCTGSRPLGGVDGVGRQFVLALPLSGPEQNARLLPMRLAAGEPASRVLMGLARSLDAVAGELPPALCGKFHAGLVAMVEAVLEQAGPPAVRGLTRLTAYHLERIKSYLRAHLRDPDLRVADVARALDMSHSHLHRLFAHEGCTVAEWLWAERLANCARELAAPGHAHRGVGEVALNWGFTDLSHFSRAFKKRYGLSPRDWRAQAPWRAPLLK